MTLNPPSPLPGEPAAPGTRGSVDTMFPVVYAELRRIAESYLRKGGGATLQPTALINEAYLKLAQLPDASQWTRPHFMAVASLAMRQVLINRARDRKRLKRGGDGQRVELNDEAMVSDMTDEDLLDLDGALERLGQQDARKARVVEMRYFGGMSVEEIGAALDVGEATVKRDWAMARAWLARELGHEEGHEDRG